MGQFFSGIRLLDRVYLLAMIAHAVKTARAVAGVVKMRFVVFQRDSSAIEPVCSWIDASMDLIFAWRICVVEVG